MKSENTLRGICYKRNFLNEVIVRIDFVSPLTEIEKELPKVISQSALKSFPIEEPRLAVTQKVKVSKDNLQTTRQEFTQWNFHGRSREKRLTLTKDMMLVVYNTYTSYENLKEEFMNVANAFFECYEKAQPSRLGLRYVNQLDFQGEDALNWNEYIESNLLGLFKYKIADALPTRIFHNIEFAYPNFNLRFQYGMPNPDYPAEIRKRLFMLDYDAYFKGLIESDDIPKLLDEYHNAIQNLFEKNITRKTREMLNE